MAQKISTTLRRTSVPQNPQDVACVPMLVGNSSAGPLNTPTTISTLTDLDTFGYGELVEAAAAALLDGGAPVYVTRSENTTAGSNGTPVKAPAAVSATSLYGGILLPGADANGEVFVTAKASGLTVVMVDPAGNNVPLSHTYASGLITITLATDGASVITTTGTDLATYIDASISAYLDAVVQGTGASLVTAMASTAISNGDIAYTPLMTGVTVAHVASGNNTSLSVSVSTKAITVNLATDANGTPTSTAAQVVAAVAASAASMLVSSAASGTGAGYAGVWSAQTITFGSTAALSLSGTPNYSLRLRIRCTRAGTVGTSPYPKIEWSVDDGVDDNYSAETLIPSTGVVTLSDSTITTGVTATFTGVLAVDDEWYAATTGPVSTSTAALTAIQAALDNSDNVDRPWGFCAVMTPLTRSQVGSVDTKAQTALQSTRKPYFFVQTRDIGTGAGDSDETEAEWRGSIESDFAGYTSAKGLVSVCAGHIEHLSPYCYKQFRRPLVLAAAARRTGVPMHENLGKTNSGPITNLGTVYGELLVEGSASVNGGLRYYARDEKVSVIHAVSGASTAFALSVSGKLVTITCATDGASANITTAARVREAIMSDVDACALLRAEYTGDGTGIVGTLAQTVLAGTPALHDERNSTGLGDRFITTTTYDEHPGAIYFDGAPTMRAQDDSDFDSVERVATILGAARVAHVAAFQEINSTPAVIVSAESSTVPAGAIEKLAARAIERRCGEPVASLLFKVKTDGEPSASPYGDVKPVEVLRNYSLRSTNELRMNVNVVLLGRVSTIALYVGGAQA